MSGLLFYVKFYWSNFQLSIDVLDGCIRSMNECFVLFLFKMYFIDVVIFSGATMTRDNFCLFVSAIVCFSTVDTRQSASPFVRPSVHQTGDNVLFHFNLIDQLYK